MCFLTVSKFTNVFLNCCWYCISAVAIMMQMVSQVIHSGLAPTIIRSNNRQESPLKNSQNSQMAPTIIRSNNREGSSPRNIYIWSQRKCQTFLSFDLEVKSGWKRRIKIGAPFKRTEWNGWEVDFSLIVWLCQLYICYS